MDEKFLQPYILIRQCYFQSSMKLPSAKIELGPAYE